jgi:hypothetical protein
MKAAECFCGSHFWFHLISWGWANIQFLAQWCALNQSAVWASWAAWLAWKTERSTVRHLRRMMLGQEIVTPGKEAIWRHRETENQYRMYKNHQTKFPFDNIEAEGGKKNWQVGLYALPRRLMMCCEFSCQEWRRWSTEPWICAICFFCSPCCIMPLLWNCCHSWLQCTTRAS